MDTSAALLKILGTLVLLMAFAPFVKVGVGAPDLPQGRPETPDLPQGRPETPDLAKGRPETADLPQGTLETPDLPQGTPETPDWAAATRIWLSSVVDGQRVLNACCNLLIFFFALQLSHGVRYIASVLPRRRPGISEKVVVIRSELTVSDSVEEAKFSRRVRIRSILSRPDDGAGLAGKTLKVSGLVKKGREQGKGSFAFIELNDGSCLANLQLIIYSDVAPPLSQFTPTGTRLRVEGVLQMPPEDKQGKQSIELRVSKVLRVGPADPATYPFPKTRFTLEYTRDYPHLRPRTDAIAAIARIRHALAIATHTFFSKDGFLYVHTPIITTSDCEGAGDKFQVTTLINEAEKIEKELIKNPPPSQEEVDAAKAVVKEKGEAVAKLKSDKAGKPEITAAVAELTKAKENVSKLVERFNQKPGIPKKDGKVDYSQDFFARPVFLTVSGQLQAETFACGLGSVYTFGPTFRAEHSHTSRHLAEFWMVESEIADADIEDAMDCAEEYVRFLCQWLLDNCYDDMEFMVEKFDKKAIQRLQMVASTDFIRLSYTEAVKILEEAVSKGHKFENKVEWGIDLASEHEKYLTETKFESPVIVYNYPKGIKAFYMKLNPDKKTVAAMDVLVPKVGELIGGSQREENYEILKERMLEMGVPLEPFEWYLDLRRYGTVEHSGFGLGFDRMILFATGIDNIRDVIPLSEVSRKSRSLRSTWDKYYKYTHY